MKREYLEVSIFLSMVSIAITVFINHQISKTYLKVDGKTRALFGVTEVLQFGYQYYVAIFGTIALILAILGSKGNNYKGKKVTAILLSILAIITVFARIWRLFI